MVLENELRFKKFDLVIIDGDMTNVGVKSDIDLIENKWEKCLIINAPNSDVISIVENNISNEKELS
jgi:hypothetical protein